MFLGISFAVSAHASLGAHTEADGLAICCAVCERLMHLRVYTLFATHFFEICGVLAARAGFRSMHLEILEEPHQEGARRRFCVQRVESLQVPGERANA